MQSYQKYKKKYMNLKNVLEHSKQNYNRVIIIGGGCAGLTSAIYCARANLLPLLFAGELEYKGGLLTKTSVVENYPGFIDGILGYDLIENMEKQAIKYGTTIVDENVKGIEILKQDNKNIFCITDNNDKQYYAYSVIISTGSTPNKLKLEAEDKFWANGISSCAVCDGALYTNKKIVVVGGGDTALEQALFLTKFSNVILIHRRDSFRGSKIMQNKVFNNNKIKILFNTEIIKLNGNNKLESIICKNNKSTDEFTLEVNGLFYGLGLTPNSKLFKDIIDIDSEGYIIKHVDNRYETSTSVLGIFVAGDVSDKIYRQAVVACGDGCKASLDVDNYLSTIL